MRILGIETSCDETSAAIVDDGSTVLSNVVASQIPVHQRFGGVVPEIASRQHVLAISEVTDEALREAGTSVSHIDAVAVTSGPGLSGALLVGINFAKGVAMASDLELIQVNHIEGHLLSVWLAVSPEYGASPELPMVSLVASGGHTQLVLVEKPARYQILGATKDDAAGEAFDKVGRLLGLPYPGGPSIERAAAECDGGQSVPRLPRAWLPESYDFSFSGLKTAVVRAVRDIEQSGSLSVGAANCLAREFQESVADVLTRKLAQAVEESEAASAAIVGGVANNSFVREMARQRLSVPLYVPPEGLSSDNAAMIAGAAYWHRTRASYALDAAPSLSLPS